MSRNPDRPRRDQPVTLRLKRLRTLGLATGTGPGRGPFISAASGLVAVGKWLYVIADDELHLGVFPTVGAARGSLIRLLPGALPEEPAMRKARKPDFEVLTVLPPFRTCPHGALLALGSGSRPNRRRGVLLPLDKSGAPGTPPQVINMAGLCAELAGRLGEVNVEGAVVLGKQLCLLNRGHPGKGGSSVVRVGLGPVLRSLAGAGAIDALPVKVRHYDLGVVRGVPLGFTDGAALPDGRLVFAAVAERADDSYQDGPCVASAVGQIGADGGLGQWLRLPPSRKVEGITARLAGKRLQLLLVTDADNAQVPAGLYAADSAERKKKGPGAARRGPRRQR